MPIRKRLALGHTLAEKALGRRMEVQFGFAHSSALFDVRESSLLSEVDDAFERERSSGTAQSLKDAIPCREGFLLVECLSGFCELRQTASFGELIHRKKGAACVGLII